MKSWADYLDTCSTTDGDDSLEALQLWNSLMQQQTKVIEGQQKKRKKKKKKKKTHLTIEDEWNVTDENDDNQSPDLFQLQREEFLLETLKSYIRHRRLLNHLVPVGIYCGEGAGKWPFL